MRSARIVAAFFALLAAVGGGGLWLLLSEGPRDHPRIWYATAAIGGLVLVTVLVRAVVKGVLPAWFRRFLDDPPDLD